MKTRIFLIVGLFLLTSCYAISNETSTSKNTSSNGSITVRTSPDLYNLSVRWADEYCRLNPGVNIHVIKTQDKDLPGMLNEADGIGFLTDASFAVIDRQSSWNMVLGHDIIVPVMNPNNPFLQDICKNGITREGFARMFDSRGIRNWGELTGNGSETPVHVYIPNDASIKASVAKFVSNNALMVEGTNVANSKDLLAAIQKDPNAIGFCRLVDLIGAYGKTLSAGVRLVPVDKNGNGKIDYMENIYDNLQTFSRGVWIGKYPKALSGNIHSVTNGKPSNKTETAFLKWILTDGQQFLGSNGFSDLVNNERQTQLDKLQDTTIILASQGNDSYAIVKIIFMVAFFLIVIGFFADMIVRRFRDTEGAVQTTKTAGTPVFDENSVNIPNGLYFDKSHTWAFMEQDGTVKVGIDDFLQHITGPLTRIEMKKAGEKIRKGDLLLTLVQKGKQLNIHAPVSGTITGQNKSLLTNSSALNASPYTDGWVYLIEPANWLRDIQFLSMAEKYRTWLKGEFARLKDFFATTLNGTEPELAQVILQDGGAIKENILVDFGPEVWEDFQTKFIDCAR